MSNAVATHADPFTKDSHVDSREALLERLQQASFQLLWDFKREAEAVFAAAELKPLEAFVLELTARGSPYPKDLAEALNTSAPLISTLLRDLEGRKLLKRSLDPADHRRTRLSLTKQGEALRNTLRATWRETQRAKLERLSERDLDALDRIHHTLLETP